jgi:hypothetical protein
MADTTSPTLIDVSEVLAIDAFVTRTTGTPEFGITAAGFVPKSFARLLAEKLALAQSLFGNTIDLTSGSALRKLLEVTALEDARTWAALGALYDNSFVSTATGQALSLLGAELGFPRPYAYAKGTINLTLTGELPPGATQVKIPRGARMFTDGGHHVATDQTAILSTATPTHAIAVFAFYPGPEHNLDPAFPAQVVRYWNFNDPMLEELALASPSVDEPIVTIEHTAALTGGDLQWTDARYRQLLLRVPRSIWTVDALRLAVSLVPGVRQVVVRDGFGGLDINQSIFGNFNFIERVFGSERDLGSPYYFTVLVAPTPAAVWEGADGLKVAIESAIEDLRPIGIFPRVEQVGEVGIGIQADLSVKGLPLPAGTPATVDASAPALALKIRLLDRVRTYIDSLEFGEPVRVAEVIWAMMNEPGVADIANLRLLRYPPHFDAVDFSTPGSAATDIQTLGYGENVALAVDQIPVLVDDPTRMKIV